MTAHNADPTRSTGRNVSDFARRPWWRHAWKLMVVVAVVLLIWRIIGDRDAASPGLDVLPPAADGAARFVPVDEFVPPPGTAAQPVAATHGTVTLLVNLEDDRDDLEATLERRFGLELRLNSIHADDANLFRVDVPASEAARLAAEIEAIDGVEHAELDGVMEAFGDLPAATGVTPNDPLYMYQWNFDQVNAEGAWSLATGAGVVVAVIDTGVAFEEGSRGRKRGILVPDLKQTGLTTGYDFVDDDESPYDQHGHGTHVAGTVAQSTHNDYGVAGLAYGARIMPLRVLDGQGRGNFADVADAIRFAADHDADVVNLSLGAFVPSREVESAIRYAHDQGVVVVAAAGNSGTRIRSYPAAFEHVIAVAATQYDRKTTFYSNYGTYIDLAAPGGNTMLDQNGDGKPDGVMQETLKRGKDGAIVFEPVFALYMGTSMAAPHVAAAAALLVEHGITHPDEVERILKDSASEAGKDGWDEHYGHGILDVSAALREHVVRNGLYRVGFALLLALLVVWRLRRREGLWAERPSAGFWLGWGLGAGVLFFLPLVLGQHGLLGGTAAFLGRPLVTWDTLLFSTGQQSPLFASALPVLGCAGLLLGVRWGRHLTAGFGLATAAVLLAEVALHTIDVGWIPGVGLLDQSWLAVNALVAGGIGYLALKRG